jgi:tetratricopeptide (TPR) repeat protein
MMKKILFVCLSLLASNFARGQSAGSPALNPTVKIQEKVYKKALENNDLEVATVALYQLIALQPENKSWEDSLCLLYHGRGYYLQSAKLAVESIKRNPNSLAFRELFAQALESLGNYKEAMEQYDYLHNVSKNAVFMYKSATMLFALKRYEESESLLNKIVLDPETKELTISTQPDLNVNQMKNIPIRAAVLNLLGVIFMEQKRTKEARKAFDEALVYYPAYILVQQNIQQLKKSEQSVP